MHVSEGENEHRPVNEFCPVTERSPADASHLARSLRLSGLGRRIEWPLASPPAYDLAAKTSVKRAELSRIFLVRVQEIFREDMNVAVPKTRGDRHSCAIDCSDQPGKAWPLDRSARTYARICPL